ncbi:MAG TPA: PIG-L family deacetylase [Nocardioidaceae bacterium]|nr:PIG-L family deacetylase [Nocardioidaceae bacterium]
MFPGLSLDRGARLLVVVAHPDDETFGCGSLLLRAAAEGLVTGVCCATRGEAGEIAPGADVPGADLGRVREDELRRAAALLGVTHVDLLGFEDSGMSGDPAPSALAAATPATVRESVRSAAQPFDPDVLVTLDASDGHRDHVVMRDATLGVGDQLGLPVYLHCLPRSLMQQWVDHMLRDRPETEHLAVREQLGELGTPDELVDVVLDQTDHLGARETAISAHRSQTSPFEGLPPELRRAFLGHDHLQRAR